MAAIASVNSYEYGAGTCTLRLVGELSPLSQITGRPVLGRSRFHLEVHQGDRPGEPGASRAVIFEARGREPQFSALSELVQTYVQRYLSASALGSAGVVSGGGHSLQPVGLTRHRLTLAVPPAPPQVVELSTLQLSDLADAIERADSNLQLLPDTAMAKVRRPRPRLPIWLGSVAAVGIAAILGNQFLTTSPPAVILSPSASQTSPDSTAQGAAENQPPTTLGESTPRADAEADASASSAAPDAPAPGDAPPAPAPAVPPVAAPAPSTPKASPPPSPPAPPEPAPPTPTTPAPAAPAQATGLSGERAPLSDADRMAEQPPTSGPDEALRAAPATPEAFEAASGIAAATAPAAAAPWLDQLTRLLQQQWRPPANLAAPLGYRLTLEPDGTVSALVPLNDFAATYQSLPTLPQVGTALPDLVRDGATTVEVQFLPTGEVVVDPLEQPTNP